MARIADADERRSGADALYGALAEGGRVGEAPVVQNIIHVQSRDTHLDAPERNALQLAGVIVLSHMCRLDVVFASRLSVEQVHADERTI